MKKSGSKPSRDHHYLPVFYLKGFTNSKGNLFIYDKLNDKILEEQPPKNFFFEKHLNNIKREGKTVLSLEDSFYMEHDKRASYYLHSFLSITNFESDEKIAEYTIELCWFIINLFWRIPFSRQKLEELMEAKGLQNEFFQIIDRTTREPAPKDITDKLQWFILNIEKQENVKGLRLTYPFICFHSGEFLRLAQRAKDYTISIDPYLITGDNPIIQRSKTGELDDMLGEAIFPLSYNRLFTSIKKSLIFINKDLLMKINILLLHQSERFICSGNLENLKYIINSFKIFRDTNSLMTLQNDVFAMIDELSNFSNMHDYLESKRKK